MKRFLLAIVLVVIGSWGDGPVNASNQNCNTTCYDGNCATQCY